MKIEEGITHDPFAIKIAQGFRKWANEHFDPDFPVLVTDEFVLTPRQIADEIERQTEFGRVQIGLYRYIVDDNPGVRNKIDGLGIAHMFEAGFVLYHPEILTEEQRSEIRAEAAQKLAVIRLKSGLYESTRY